MVALAIERPTWGQVRVSNKLKKRIAKHSDLGRSSMKCLHVSVDHLGEFGSFIRRHVSRGHRFRILTSVNCSAHTASLIADAFKRNPFTGYEPLAEFPNVDGVVALTHKTGCGMAAGEGLQLLRRTLAGYARHPNFSHVIVLGLGCEVNQISEMLREHKLTDRIRNMDIQSMGGIRKTVEAGLAFVREVLQESNQVSRRPFRLTTSTSPCNVVARTGTPGCRQTRRSGSRATWWSGTAAR